MGRFVQFLCVCGLAFSGGRNLAPDRPDVPAWTFGLVCLALAMSLALNARRRE